MCEDCGCGDSELVPVAVHERILAGNDARAAHLREHFVEAGVLAINLMGSPGAGKTAVLEQTARLAGAAPAARSGLRRSGDRPRRAAPPRRGDHRRADHDGIGVSPRCAPGSRRPARSAVARARHILHRERGQPRVPRDLTISASRQRRRAVGHGGRRQAAQVPRDVPTRRFVLLTKVDLLPHLEVDLDAIRDGLARVMPEPRMISISGKTGEGIPEWLAWLEARRPIARVVASTSLRVALPAGTRAQSSIRTTR